MRRNFLLFLGVITAILLGVNSFRRILNFRATSLKVAESEARLDVLKRENESLKQDLVYKTSPEYQEAEIRNKLGLAKEGESVVILPRDDEAKEESKSGRNLPNWKKWWRLFFET